MDSIFFSEVSIANINQLYGNELTNEMIQQSVMDSCDFFHLKEPSLIMEADTTGVYTNLSFSQMDDVLVYNPNQLWELGITGKDSLDLVMTYDGTHRMLQGMDTGYDSHQKELCCDFMSGVRAGLNDMDIDGLKYSLSGLEETDTHPAGELRAETVQQGLEFANEYMDTYHIPPTFAECLEGFNESIAYPSSQADGEFMGYNSLPNDEEYHVSFGGKTVTVKQVGGGLLKEEVEICKIDGTSDTYEVKLKNGKVVDKISSIRPGTKVEINGIDYKIP